MLFVRFVVSLDDHHEEGDSTSGSPLGPMFNRWLPDGKADAIALPVADSRNEIRVWFERRCRVTDGFLRYDAQERVGFDAARMQKQGRINAGYMFGEAAFVAVTNAELKAVRDNQKNSADYIALGRRLTSFLIPTLGAFVDVLRFQYGQYWLRPIMPWDSRTESLGNYCGGLQIQWTENRSDESSWRDFRPTDSVIQFEASIHRGDAYEVYLTESDWRSLQARPIASGSSALALEMVSEAQKLRRDGHLRAALIQSVTALEIALGTFWTARETELPLPSAIKATTKLREAPLTEQLSVVAALAKGLSSATVETAIEAITSRNSIVHEGASPEVHERFFVAVFECAKRLVEIAPVKFPDQNMGNEILP